MSDPLTVGLVGAGPWAGAFHAPMIQHGPGTRLAAVWARRPDAAAALAAKYQAKAASSFDELLDGCEAVAFAVPPDIQARYAPRAAAAGRHLLLEKPLGFTLAEARAVADAVAEAGVISQIVLTNRYREPVRTFIHAARAAEPIGATAEYLGGGARPGGVFATPWRVRRGALLDLGPHMLDLLDAAVGPIAEVHAAGDPARWVALTVRHENDALSQAALSITAPMPVQILNCLVVTEAGPVQLQDSPGYALDDRAEVQKTIMHEFTEAVRSGSPHPLDAARGLYLQELLEGI
ncbi:Gfo/Idh/MocA family protein [Amycolatopsis pithecellobii]|uniref:Gfo/Idh/MocA family oxidoreductase n=1 Tax=Amycolatopsis pithecellobii TaxID=664692 RepID=A0A6N7Z968_9PSEU|nr:Gfo/Idh/MocA family oxidoreductase [Amycolatopsis pithecellobii]MTD58246.1 gfo/Idh/MocA family oxidoreductase [Amycolatopsis pithecellobii]